MTTEPAEPAEPLAHIERPPLPWQQPSLTECGRPLDDIRGDLITRDEAARRVKRDGVTRFAYRTCITCWQTAERWPAWDIDPVTAMHRWVEAGRYHRRGAAEEQTRRELIALAAVVLAHKDEFDAMVAGLAETTELRPRRRRTGP